MAAPTVIGDWGLVVCFPATEALPAPVLVPSQSDAPDPLVLVGHPLGRGGEGGLVEFVPAAFLVPKPERVVVVGDIEPVDDVAVVLALSGREVRDLTGHRGLGAGVTWER